MNSAGHLETLRDQRDRQIAKLRGHVECLVPTQNQPAAWVGAHPWVAILGAATAGFIAARFTRPPPRERPGGYARPRRRARSLSHEDGRHRRKMEPTNINGWLEILLALVEPLFSSLATSREGCGAPHLRVGNAGSTVGSVFPGAFAAHDCGVGPKAKAPIC